VLALATHSSAQAQQSTDLLGKVDLANSCEPIELAEPTSTRPEVAQARAFIAPIPESWASYWRMLGILAR